MLSKEENELLCRVGPGTPMGTLMRRYWLPALLSWELPAPDCAPLRVRLLGEDLVAFRDTSGRVGIAGRGLSRTASPRCGWGVTRTTACAASTTAGSSTSTATASTR